MLKSGFLGERMVIIPKKIIKKFIQDALPAILYITDIGYFPIALDHYRKRRKGSDEYILVFCIDGKGYIKQNHIQYELKPNQYCILPPNSKHIYYSDRKNPWSIYWLHFQGEYSKEIYIRYKDQNQERPVTIHNSSERISEFEYLMEIYNLGFTQQVFEYSSLILPKLLGSFLYYSVMASSTIKSENKKLVNEIKGYMNDHIYESLTIKNIEIRFHRSASNLFKLFKHETGYSLIIFFNLIKVQKACELLNLTDSPINEIAYKLNFQDPLYFSRVFRKFMGVSPTQYRKSFSA